jgi:hypothetical protein
MATNDDGQVQRVASFKIPEDEWLILQEAAAREDRSVSAVIRRAIRVYLADRDTPKDAA